MRALLFFYSFILLIGARWVSKDRNVLAELAEYRSKEVQYISGQVRRLFSAGRQGGHRGMPSTPACAGARAPWLRHSVCLSCNRAACADVPRRVSPKQPPRPCSPPFPAHHPPQIEGLDSSEQQLMEQVRLAGLLEWQTSRLQKLLPLLLLPLLLIDDAG